MFLLATPKTEKNMIISPHLGQVGKKKQDKNSKLSKLSVVPQLAKCTFAFLACNISIPFSLLE